VRPMAVKMARTPQRQHVAVAAGRPVAAPPRKVTAGRVIAAVIALVAAAEFLATLITRPAMQWDVVGKYLFSSIVLNGVKLTVILTIISQALAVVLGTVLALMALSNNVSLNIVARIYLWIFRGVPALVQLLFWFNLAILYPTLGVALPFGGPTLVSEPTNKLVTVLLAAILGLGLHEAAYMSDVVRSSLQSVDRGQQEAATALGLTSQQTFWKVTVPQAMRVMVPNTGNRTIGMLKFTSLASFLAVSELLYSVQSVYNRTLQTIPLLMVATVWYLLCVSVLTWLQHRVERHYTRDAGNIALTFGPGAGEAPPAAIAPVVSPPKGNAS